MQAVESQTIAVDPPRDNGPATVSVLKAYPDDFQRVYPLLQDFGISRLTKNDWRRIFNTDFDSPESHCGYLLEINDEVTGFLGLLFSDRTIRGRFEKFCNLTSWIVKADSRSHSLKLMLAALKEKDCTITNFTPSTGVVGILEKLGFTELQTNEQILLPVPGGSLSRTTYRCIFDSQEITKRLNEVDRKIFSHHQGFDCRHVLISSGDEYCYLVLKNRQYKHLPFARVQYLSNSKVFAEGIDSMRVNLCLKLKVAGLIVDNRYVDGRAFAYSRKYPKQCQAFFKSRTVHASEIDTLYSEMILLHD